MRLISRWYTSRIRNTRLCQKTTGFYKKTTNYFKDAYQAKAFQMAAAILVFIGFRTGFFSFETSFKLPFLLAGAAFFMVMILLVQLQRRVHLPGSIHQKTRMVVRKEYRYYYIS